MKLTIEPTKSLPPGVYPDIPDETYNAWGDTVRSGWLGVLDQKTPAHLRYSVTHPQPTTPAQFIGRLIHVGVLEPARFEQGFARGPDVKLSTKHGKELWERAEEDNEGKTLLRYHDYEVVNGVVESIWTRPEHEEIRDTLEACDQRELTVIWVDEETGLPCRMRMDALGLMMGISCDLKTCASAQLEAFERSILSFSYDIQAGFYRMGAEAVGWDIQDSLWIAAEKEPPYLARIVRVAPRVVSEGKRKARRALEVFSECHKAGRWPAYTQLDEAAYPDWYMRRLDREEGRAWSQ